MIIDKKGIKEMTVSMNVYSDEFNSFVKKHNKKAEVKIYTSPMVDNVYHKEYCWSDGATWYERTELVEEIVEAEKYGYKMLFTAKFYKTEFWSTESGSKYFYERA